MQPSVLCAPASLRPNRRETPCALQGLLPEKAAAEPDRTDMVWRFEQPMPRLPTSGAGDRIRQ